MIRTVVGLGAACVVMNATWVAAQPLRAVPRPPAQAPGPPRAEDGSAAPDGYAPKKRERLRDHCPAVQRTQQRPIAHAVGD